MSDTVTEWTANGAETAPKEPKSVRMKFGSGPEWPVPVDVIKTLLTSAWGENAEFMGRHLQYALTGEMPKSRRQRQNGGGGEQ